MLIDSHSQREAEMPVERQREGEEQRDRLPLLAREPLLTTVSLSKLRLARAVSTDRASWIPRSKVNTD